MLEYAKKELEIIKHNKKEEILNILKILDEQNNVISVLNLIKNYIKNNEFKLIPTDIRSVVAKQNIDEIKPFLKNMNDKDRSIILKLIDCKPLSILENSDDNWRYINGNHYRHKRIFTLIKDKLEDRPYCLYVVICNCENDKFISKEVIVEETNETYLLKKAYPKKFDEFPTINIQTTKKNNKVYTTLEEINKIKEFYDLEIKQ